MKTILLLLTAIIFTAAARADEQVISTFSWKELADAGKLTAGTLTGAPDNALKVENRGRGTMSATVLTIVQPEITTDFYAVTGEVRYDNVEGDGPGLVDRDRRRVELVLGLGDVERLPRAARAA